MTLGHFTMVAAQGRKTVREEKCGKGEGKYGKDDERGDRDNDRESYTKSEREVDNVYRVYILHEGRTERDRDRDSTGTAPLRPNMI